MTGLCMGMASSSTRRCGLARGEATFQYVRFEAAFAQDVGGGGAAAAGVAAHHVLGVLVQRIELEARAIQRDIDCAVDTKVLKFAGHTYIQPFAAGGDDLLDLVLVLSLQQRLVEQGLKVL